MEKSTAAILEGIIESKVLRVKSVKNVKPLILSDARFNRKEREGIRKEHEDNFLNYHIFKILPIK